MSTDRRIMDTDVASALRDRPLRVGMVPLPPYFILHQHGDGREELTGFCIDLINILAQSLNFSYEVVMPADREWGDEHDGQWTGLLGLIQRKEADMAFLLSPSLHRSKVAQWTVPLEYWYNNMAVRTHTVQADSWNAFLSPFQWTVYTYILVTFVLCTCFLLLVVRTERRVSSGSQHSLSLTQVIQFLYGFMINRAMSWTGTGGAGRVFIAAWCMLGLMLTSCYTSKLTSLFVGVTSSPPFTSVGEMLTRDDYRWGILGGTKLVQILRTSNNSMEQELYSRMMTFAEDDPEVLSPDLNVHLTKVLSENYAYIGDSPLMDTWALENCEITVLSTKLTGLEGYSIMLPLDSLITEHINNVLLRLHDSGSLLYLRTRWFPSATRCHGNQVSKPAISLATLQGPFYVAVAGLVIAAGVLFIERTGRKSFLRE